MFTFFLAGLILPHWGEVAQEQEGRATRRTWGAVASAAVAAFVIEVAVGGKLPVSAALATAAAIPVVIIWRALRRAKARSEVDRAMRHVELRATGGSRLHLVK